MEFYQYQESNTLRKLVNWVVQIIAVIALAWFCIFAYGTKVVYSGQSMIPLLEPGETALLNRLTYRFNSPERYDVIAFDTDDNKINIKRVIGLSGETVLIKDGDIYIDGKVLTDENYLSYISLSGLASETITLAKDEYFVLGDNSDVSEDSRFQSIGNIKKQSIKGKLWLRVSPLLRIGFIK